MTSKEKIEIEELEKSIDDIDKIIGYNRPKNDRHDVNYVVPLAKRIDSLEKSVSALFKRVEEINKHSDEQQDVHDDFEQWKEKRLYECYDKISTITFLRYPKRFTRIAQNIECVNKDTYQHLLEAYNRLVAIEGIIYGKGEEK